MRNRKWTGLLAGVAVLVMLGLPAHGAAQAGDLTVDRIFGSDDFATSAVAPRWLADGESFTVVETTSGGSDLWVEGIRTGKRTRLLEGATLRVTEDAAPIEIVDYEWSADERKLLIFSDAQRVWRQATKGTYYVYDIGERRLVPVSRQSGWQLFAKFSPDGSKVGFVRDNNLFVTDLATGTETQLTRDGSDNIINGTTDWVYEEELDLRDAWRWSPDGKRIAFWRFDQSPVALFTMLDPLGQYPVPVALRYPKAGTANSRVRVGVIDLADGATRWFDVGGSDQDYLARMDWIPGTQRVVIQRMNRHQNRIDVLVGDAATGQTRALFTESDSAWVDVDNDMTWLKGGSQFLWSSERDGFHHLYLYDAAGAVVRQVTRGPWDVHTLYGVDEANGWVYFAASVESPMQRHVYRIRLSGRDMAKLGDEAGTHSADFSPDFSLFVGSYSAMGKPPVYRLVEADGTVLRVLEGNESARAAVDALGLPRPEFVQIPAADGVTKLNAYVMRPRPGSATGRHPVLMYVYGGPGSQTVTDAWGGSRYLWHQLLAQKGYVVVSVDNRGTGARGRDFKKATYLNLGRLETDDQIAAARYLGTLSYVDPARIGIWGWSYGGYMSALSLGRGGDVFRAAVSVAPVTDWKLYDTIYTERFMRTPQENPNGYRDGSPLHHTAGMRGDLLLVHGTGDDNVHDQNTLQLMQALIEEGKQFDLMLYPNRTHSIAGGNTQVHLFTMITNWLDEHLMQ